MSHDEFPDAEPFAPLPEQVGTGPIGKGAMAAAVAAATLMFPPAMAVVAIPIAAGGAWLQGFGEQLNNIQKVRSAELIGAAAFTANLSPEEVIQQIIEREDLVLLAAEAFDAARRSRLNSKALALGKSLGSIISDDALIDRESIWIRILSVVEPPHVRVLKHFVTGQETVNGSTYWRPGLAVSVHTIGERVGLEDAVLPLVQDLLRCGLLMSPGVNGGTADSLYATPDALAEELRATWLGAELFSRLENEAGEPS